MPSEENWDGFFMGTISACVVLGTYALLGATVIDASLLDVSVAAGWIIIIELAIWVRNACRR